jgi:hypothetical protein
MHFRDDAFLGAETAGHDHFAVFGERFADRIERFLDCRVDEAAGIDDDEVRIVIRRRGGVALGAQLGKDALRIDEGLGTA